MTGMLSQEEVNALLRDFDVVSECAHSDQEKHDENDVVAYDLLRTERCIQGKTPAIEAVNARFCHTLKQTLSSSFRQLVHVDDQSVQVMPFREVVRLVEFPTAVGVFQMNPLLGKALLVCDKRLSFSFIGMLLGSVGYGESNLPRRDFTSIESRFLEKSFQTILLCLENAWEPVASLQPHLSRIESKQQFLNIQPSASMLVSTFQLNINQVDMRMLVCLPQSMIDPIRSHLNLSWKKNLEEDATSKKKLEMQVSQTSVSLKVELGKTKIKLREFLTLKTGDCLALNQAHDEPLNALVEDVVKFRGVQGALHGHLAFKVTERVQTPKLTTNWLEALLSQRS